MEKQSTAAEDTVSGVKKTGDIDDIIEFSKKLKKVMEEEGVKQECVKDFERWRPRKKDSEKDMNIRTAQHASVPFTKTEKESNGVKKDMKEAKEDFEDAAKQMKHPRDKKKRHILEGEVKDGSKKIFRPLACYTLKACRKIEENIYSRFMLKFNSYYFDADKFNIRFERKGSKYIMYVDSPEEEYRQRIRAELGNGGKSL